MKYFFKCAKEFYESKLIEGLKNLFGAETGTYNAHWSSEIFVGTVDVENGGDFISYSFMIGEDDECVCNATAYSRVMDGDQVVGVLPRGSQITYSTFSEVKSLMEEVLATEVPMEEKADEKEETVPDEMATVSDQSIAAPEHTGSESLLD